MVYVTISEGDEHIDHEVCRDAIRSAASALGFTSEQIDDVLAEPQAEVQAGPFRLSRITVTLVFPHGDDFEEHTFQFANCDKQFIAFNSYATSMSELDLKFFASSCVEPFRADEEIVYFEPRRRESEADEAEPAPELESELEEESEPGDA